MWRGSVKEGLIIKRGVSCNPHCRVSGANGDISAAQCCTVANFTIYQLEKLEAAKAA